MTDSENDDLDDSENEDKDDNLENKKYDDKFDCYNYNDNEIYTMYLENRKIDNVKIEKTADYYNLFLSMLKSDTSVYRVA